MFHIILYTGASNGNSMGLITRWINRRKIWVAQKRNKIPAYVITDSGIKTKWVNPDSISEKPYDTETYPNHQIFYKNIANPITIKTSDIDNNINSDDVIFSQKYKTYMKQSVLNQVFRGGGWEPKKIMYLLFANIGLTAILGLIAIVGVFQ